MRAREETQKVLSSRIPSASQIVKDAETLDGILHKDLETAQEARVRPEEHNHLLHLMTNIRQQKVVILDQHFMRQDKWRIGLLYLF